MITHDNELPGQGYSTSHRDYLQSIGGKIIGGKQLFKCRQLLLLLFVQHKSHKKKPGLKPKAPL